MTLNLIISNQSDSSILNIFILKWLTFTLTDHRYPKFTQNVFEFLQQPHESCRRNIDVLLLSVTTLLSLKTFDPFVYTHNYSILLLMIMKDERPKLGPRRVLFLAKSKGIVLYYKGLTEFTLILYSAVLTLQLRWQFYHWLVSDEIEKFWSGGWWCLCIQQWLQLSKGQLIVYLLTV